MIHLSKTLSLSLSSKKRQLEPNCASRGLFTVVLIEANLEEAAKSGVLVRVAEREMQVPCEVAVTVPPEMGKPVLSETVPEERQEFVPSG